MTAAMIAIIAAIQAVALVVTTEEQERAQNVLALVVHSSVYVNRKRDAYRTQDCNLNWGVPGGGGTNCF
jgi:hypothetical protein